MTKKLKKQYSSLLSSFYNSFSNFLLWKPQAKDLLKPFRGSFKDMEESIGNGISIFLNLHQTKFAIVEIANPLDVEFWYYVSFMMLETPTNKFALLLDPENEACLSVKEKKEIKQAVQQEAIGKNSFFSLYLGENGHLYLMCSHHDFFKQFSQTQLSRYTSLFSRDTTYHRTHFELNILCTVCQIFSPSWKKTGCWFPKDDDETVWWGEDLSLLNFFCPFPLFPLQDSILEKEKSLFRFLEKDTFPESIQEQMVYFKNIALILSESKVSFSQSKIWVQFYFYRLYYRWAKNSKKRVDSHKFELIFDSSIQKLLPRCQM